MQRTKFRKGAVAILVALAMVFALCGCDGGSETQPQSGQTYIGEEAAKQAALKHAGVAGEHVDRMSAELDSKAAPVVYVVEFYSGEYVYRYRVDAVSGEILAHDQKPEDADPDQPGTATRPSIPSDTYMTAQNALEFALDHAGAEQEQIQLLGLTLDESDEDKVHYDCHFIFENYEYGYEIHAVTGEVLDYTIEELEEGEDPTGTATLPTQPPAAQIIEKDAALAAALAHQKTDETQAEVIKIELVDAENGDAYGGAYYVVTYDWDGFRYTYHIDGVSAKVLTYEVTEVPGSDIDDDPEEDNNDDIYDDDDDFFGEDDDPFFDDEFGDDEGDFGDEEGDFGDDEGDFGDDFFDE